MARALREATNSAATHASNFHGPYSDHHSSCSRCAAVVLAAEVRRLRALCESFGLDPASLTAAGAA